VWIGEEKAVQHERIIMGLMAPFLKNEKSNVIRK